MLVEPALLVGAVLAASLVAYVLTGGADFGGGVWDLFATGPRRKEQRRLIAHAIAPIWEANHVWLILVVVVLFVCFPPAFATLSTALHIPLTVTLVGIVLRGSAFVFRAYDPAVRDAGQTSTWQTVFAVASTVTPFMLGVTLGATVSGGIRVVQGVVVTDFVSEWLAAFPMAVGGLTVAVCALLAASYLTLETDDPALRNDFRVRGLVASVAVVVFAWVALWLGPPHLQEGLLRGPWAAPLHAVTAAAGGGGLVALWSRRWRTARALLATEVALVVGGLAAVQWPWLVPGAYTLTDAAAPSSVLWAVLACLAGGIVLLVPALVWLFRVFKRR